MKQRQSFIDTSFIMATLTSRTMLLQQQSTEKQSIIVQGSDLAAVKTAVASVRGAMTDNYTPNTWVPQEEFTALLHVR